MNIMVNIEKIPMLAKHTFGTLCLEREVYELVV